MIEMTRVDADELGCVPELEHTRTMRKGRRPTSNWPLTTKRFSKAPPSTMRFAVVDLLISETTSGLDADGSGAQPRLLVDQEVGDLVLSSAHHLPGEILEGAAMASSSPITGSGGSIGLRRALPTDSKWSPRRLSTAWAMVSVSSSARCRWRVTSFSIGSSLCSDSGDRRSTGAPPSGSKVAFCPLPSAFRLRRR